ncbi:hypothetical protein [Alistipes sp. UBA1686]|uniref:hypothetical protein n=1 Tax=Alistipes sp. UBA1686 TaxID=1946007 RepID=UPI00257EC30A|nr:hypothetical protein [Alistipes sp. UBA1686]
MEGEAFMAASTLSGTSGMEVGESTTVGVSTTPATDDQPALAKSSSSYNVWAE